MGDRGEIRRFGYSGRVAPRFAFVGLFGLSIAALVGLLAAAGMAASVASPQTGIRLKLYSSRPGVQFYTGNSLRGPFEKHSGLCLEFQNAPNAPNVEGFPSPLLKPGHLWHRQLVMEFESH